MVRRLRPKATAGRLTENGPRRARTQIRQALALLAWLDARGTTLAELRQADLDRWLTEGTTTRLAVSSFLRWAKGRRLVGDVQIPLPATRSPAAPVADDERWTLIERLLHDDTVTVELRVVGLFALLYGQQLTRIVRLTTDNVRCEGDRVAIRFGHDDLRLPEQLDTLCAIGGAMRHWATRQPDDGYSPAGRPDGTSPPTPSESDSTPSVSSSDQLATPPCSSSPPSCPRPSWPTCSTCTPSSRSSGSAQHEATGHPMSANEAPQPALTQQDPRPRLPQPGNRA